MIIEEGDERDGKRKEGASWNRSLKEGTIGRREEGEEGRRGGGKKDGYWGGKEEMKGGEEKDKWMRIRNVSTRGCRRRF